MAACETVAWAGCACCGGQVAMKKNRSGLVYYRCDHCGVQVQHHWRRSSDKALTAAGYIEEPAAAPEAKPAPVVEAAKPAPKKPEVKRAPAGSVASMFGL